MLSFKYVYGCTWRDVTNGFGNADFAVRVLMIDIAILVLHKVGIIEHQEHDADNSDLTITTELPITPP